MDIVVISHFINLSVCELIYLEVGEGNIWVHSMLHSEPRGLLSPGASVGLGGADSGPAHLTL